MADYFRRICTWPNLVQAHRLAAAGKRGRAPAARFEYLLADNLIGLRDSLTSGAYRPGAYTNFLIHEPKRRLISAAPFRDRVVHHALCNVIEPLFEHRFIADSYANRVGKGTHRAVARCQEFARHYGYSLQLDIRQHFPSIDHAILGERLAAVIREPRTLALCEIILASGEGILDQEYDKVFFPGDDLLAATRPRGLPIGNLTSQFWSNCYMDGLDHFVKRVLRCPAYLRYVDDLLLFGDDKRQLWAWKSAIVDVLGELRLTIHTERAQVRPVTQGIPWLGFTVFPTHRRVKRRKVVNYRHRLGELYDDYCTGRISFGELDASVQGWVNHVRYADTWGLRKAVLGGLRL